MNEHCQKHKDNANEKTNRLINVVNIFQKFGSEGRINKTAHIKDCGRDQTFLQEGILMPKNDRDSGEAQLRGEKVSYDKEEKWGEAKWKSYGGPAFWP